MQFTHFIYDCNPLPPPLLSLPQIIREIEGVTLDDVRTLAREMLQCGGPVAVGVCGDASWLRPSLAMNVASSGVCDWLPNPKSAV